MPRKPRGWISQKCGSYHIISKVAGGGILFHHKEKEYFLKLLERFSAGFFVKIHSFCIMGSHFHVMATCLEKEASQASRDELFARYRIMYGQNAEPPCGSYDDGYGDELPDEDGGVKRLRARLGSLSRFVGELKQSFSRWYNKENNRKGYLWGDRFTSIIVEKGKLQLTCSAYIDLNPIRANIVKRPEDYRWSGLGMQVRDPKAADKLLEPVSIGDILSEAGVSRRFKAKEEFEWYREFVYLSGAVERKGKASIPEHIVNEVVAYHGKLKIGDRLRYRVRNFSEGIAIGGYAMIERLQKELKRKKICPRAFIDGDWCYTTRVYRAS